MSLALGHPVAIDPQRIGEIVEVIAELAKEKAGRRVWLLVGPLLGPLLDGVDERVQIIGLLAPLLVREILDDEVHPPHPTAADLGPLGVANLVLVLPDVAFVDAVELSDDLLGAGVLEDVEEVPRDVARIGHLGAVVETDAAESQDCPSPTDQVPDPFDQVIDESESSNSRVGSCVSPAEP